MKLRIISPGEFYGSRIENAETGEPLEGVIAFQINSSRETAVVTATITVQGVALGNLVAESEITEGDPTLVSAPDRSAPVSTHQN